MQTHANLILGQADGRRVKSIYTERNAMEMYSIVTNGDFLIFITKVS